jgi:hypothetical protein
MYSKTARYTTSYFDALQTDDNKEVAATPANDMVLQQLHTPHVRFPSYSNAPYVRQSSHHITKEQKFASCHHNMPWLQTIQP